MGPKDDRHVVRSFSNSAYCCVLSPPLLAYVNHPRVLVTVLSLPAFVLKQRRSQDRRIERSTLEEESVKSSKIKEFDPWDRFLWPQYI
jgi:hypothetical protein